MADTTSNQDTENRLIFKYNKTRSVLCQVIIVSIGNAIMLQFGMSIAMSTVVNGHLMKTYNETDTKLILNRSEASWYGSLLLIFHPIGSILSSMLQDKFGRKICFTVVCIPQFFGWFSLYLAKSSIELFISSCCLGLAMGLSEAPILTYAGESIQPSIRSALSSLSSFCSIFGLWLTYVLTSFLTWRQTAFAYIFIPSSVFFLTIFAIPESPVWLLSKTRTNDAEKSLSKLRGFAKIEDVRDELNYMRKFVQYNSNNKKDINDEKRFSSMIHTSKIFTDKTVWKPFILFMVISFFCTVSCMLPAKPYLVNIIREIGMPFKNEWFLVPIGSMTFIGSFLNMFIIKVTGKKRLLMVSIFMSVMCQFLIALYALGILKLLVNSAWLPYCLFCSVSFISGFGIIPIPWILLGEIFPMKARGSVSGIGAALNCITAFMLTKTYLDIVKLASLPGTLLIYCLIGIIGIPYVYFKLPETEGKTLQQIQLEFEKINFIRVRQ